MSLRRCLAADAGDWHSDGARSGRQDGNGVGVALAVDGDRSWRASEHRADQDSLKPDLGHQVSRPADARCRKSPADGRGYERRCLFPRAPGDQGRSCCGVEMRVKQNEK